MPRFLTASLAIILAIGLASCASVPTNTSEVANPDAASTVALVPYGLPHYKRPNLLVADMERSLVIYSDILGFERAPISESSETSFSYPVFNLPPEARMRYTYLSEPDENRVFGLTEVTGISLPRPQNAPHISGSVIGVSDLRGKIEKIKALGLKTTESKIAGGAEFRFIEQAFVDYDGHLIVLYEILPPE